MKAGTLHTDGEWELNQDSLAREEIWLYHPCQKHGTPHYVFRYTYREWGDGPHCELATPCAWCGSVCPAGLRGMYLTLAVL